MMTLYSFLFDLKSKSDASEEYCGCKCARHKNISFRLAETAVCWEPAVQSVEFYLFLNVAACLNEPILFWHSANS